MNRSVHADGGSDPFPVLAAEATPEGPYVDPHPITGKPRVCGQHAAGRREGEWRWFSDDGALVRRAHYRAGLLDGAVERFHENGKPCERGEYREGRRHGTWTRFNASGVRQSEAGYDNGLRHGPADEYYPSGQLAVRCFYENDGMTDSPVKYHQNGRIKSRTDNEVQQTFFEDGTLSLEYPLKRGEYHGKARSFNEDGSPDFECEYVMGVKHGVETVWTDGKPAVTRYLCGVPEQKLKGDALKKLAGKLAKKRDSYERGDLLREIADGYSEATRLLWHLVREGLYDAAKTPDMWDDLAKDLAISGADVVAFLSSIKKFDVGDYTSNRFLPFWPETLDELVCNVYATDPGPIDAALETLPVLVRDGVRTVRARFGHDERGRFGRDMAFELATQHIEGIGSTRWGRDGQAREVRWFRDGALREVNIGQTHDADLPNAAFREFIELFTTREAFDAAVTKLVFKATERLPVGRVTETLRQAKPSEFEKLLTADRIPSDRLSFVLELRRDPPETLLEWAKKSRYAGTAETLAALAIVRAAEAGGPIPIEADALLATGAGIEEVREPWRYVRAEIKTQGDWLEQQPGQIFEQLRFGEPAAITSRQFDIYRRALAALPEDRAEAILKRLIVVENCGGADNAVALAAPCLTPALADQILAFVKQREPTFYGNSKRLALGLSCLPSTILPALFAAARKAPKGLRAFYERALLYSLAAAACRGEPWDAAFDEVITFGPGAKRDEFPFDGDYEHALRVILRALPTDRALAVFRRAWAQKAEIALRTFVGVGHHRTEEVLRPALELLIADKLKIASVAEGWIREAIALLREDGPRLVHWVLGRRKTEHDAITSAFWQCLGAEYWRALEEEAETLEGEAEEHYADPIARERLAELDEVLDELGRKGPTTPIYAVVPGKLGECGFNQIGGAPRGIAAADWPLAPDGDPMQFLFMIDVADLPELGKRLNKKDCRAVAMFVSSADHNQAWEPGNDEVALRFLDETELAALAGPLPEGAKLLEQRGFSWRKVNVPKAVFDLDPDDDEDESERTAQLRRIRTRVYQLGARALGHPIWLQEGQWDGDFLLQFDETFVPMNLGDCGVMYVFGDTAFWQCH